MKATCQLILLFFALNLSSIAFAVNDNRITIDSLLLELEVTTSPKQKVNILIQASKVASQLNSFDEAMEFSETAIDIATSNHLKKEQVKAMIELAKINKKLNNTKKAFEYAIKAKDLAEANAFTLEYSYASLLLSKIYFVIGKYDESLELAYSTLEELEKAEDYKELCDALIMVGVNYVENSNDTLAKKYLTKAINTGKEHKHYTELGIAIANLAIIYGNNNEHLVAIDIQKQGCEILEKNQIVSSRMIVPYNNISTGYIKLNMPDSAYVYLMKARDLCKKSNDIRHFAVVHLGFARYYDYINDDKNFLKSVNEALIISNSQNLVTLQFRGSSMLEDYYLKHNKMDSAYKYKNIQFELNKEINSQNIATKVAQFEILKEFEILEKERIFKQRQKTLYIIIVLIVLVSLLVSLFVLVLRYRIKVRYSILKHEKLEDEIYYKNKESTVSLMELMKKNELLADVTLELIKVSKSSKNEEIKNSINKIALKIENITKEKIWEEFSVSFQKVHSDFYKNIGDQFPDLTSNEQRLCAFLKLNLSTKEISSMTGQSERAIVMARHRLRKKLGIQSQEVNLTSFFSQF